MRFLGYLFLFALVAFGVWPYYQIFRLDDALGKDDMATLQQLVDVDAIRRNYKERVEDGLGIQPQAQDPGSALAWLQQNLQRLGDAALEQTITPEWVRDTLREAAAGATDRQPPYFMAGVTFACFESYDSFIIRLGELGRNATHVRMRLEDKAWRVTDIIR
ncbi:MAG: DUF2939 domain-containing protein [Pseudomonadota bacterium]|nr:DUF2939 domain-containing protein [Pseudomonadota bacterium]